MRAGTPRHDRGRVAPDAIGTPATGTDKPSPAPPKRPAHLCAARNCAPDSYAGRDIQKEVRCLLGPIQILAIVRLGVRESPRMREQPRVLDERQSVAGDAAG